MQDIDDLEINSLFKALQVFIAEYSSAVTTLVDSTKRNCVVVCKRQRTSSSCYLVLPISAR